MLLFLYGDGCFGFGRFSEKIGSVSYPEKRLFVAQCVDGVEHRGFLGRVPSEEDACKGADGERKENAPGLDIDRECREDIDEYGGAHADEDADHAARDADQDRFDQELRQNIAPFGSDTHAQADFPGAFGHRDIHDVHDADAAHEQRNARHGRQQQGHHVGRRSEHRRKLLLGADREVVFVGRLELVVGPQDLRDLLDGLVGIFFAQCRAGDRLQVGDGEDSLLNCGVGGQNQVVLVHTHTVITLALEYADDA